MEDHAAGFQDAPLLGVITFDIVRADMFQDLLAENHIDASVWERQASTVVHAESFLRDPVHLSQQAVPRRGIFADVNAVNAAMPQGQQVKQGQSAAAAMIEDHQIPLINLGRGALYGVQNRLQVVRRCLPRRLDHARKSAPSLT